MVSMNLILEIGGHLHLNIVRLLTTLLSTNLWELLFGLGENTNNPLVTL